MQTAGGRKKALWPGQARALVTPCIWSRLSGLPQVFKTQRAPNRACRQFCLLHEAARRRGYRRGTSVEATFVDSYLHEVSAAGLTVVISFTGTVPGSAEHPCA